MASSSDILGLDQQLCFALYAASRAVVRAYGPLLEPLGLTYPQYLVMLVLWEEDDISVKRLGERLSLDSGTLTPLLKRLEQGELVDRRRDDRDERVLRVSLTAKGRALKTKAKKIPKAIGCVTGWDIQDPAAIAKLRELHADLRALTTRLEKLDAD